MHELMPSLYDMMFFMILLLLLLLPCCFFHRPNYLLVLIYTF
jgi:hypothetical protein